MTKLKALFFRSRFKVTFQPLGVSYISVHAHEKTMDYSKLATAKGSEGNSRGIRTLVPRMFNAVKSTVCSKQLVIGEAACRNACMYVQPVSPLQRADFFRARGGIATFNSPISFVLRKMLSV